MEPTKELADALFRDKIRQARKTPPEVKLLAGGDLFDAVCERMAIGYRLRDPSATDDEVRALVRLQIERLRRKDEAR